ELHGLLEHYPVGLARHLNLHRILPGRVFDRLLDGRGTTLRYAYSYARSPVSASPTINVWISFVPSYVKTDSRLFMWRITGYSSVIPLAPRIERASRATSSAARTLFSLP